MAPKAVPKKQAAEDPRHTQAVKDYESGLRALQERKFEKAKASLQKVLGAPDKSIVDRAQVHIATCNQHLEAPTLHFKTSEEHFDYTISLRCTASPAISKTRSGRSARPFKQTPPCASRRATISTSRIWPKIRDSRNYSIPTPA
jgi:hypothetical protein